MNNCTSCGQLIENTQVTGIFCSSCHNEEMAPSNGWRPYIKGPAGIALVAGGIPSAFDFAVNGISYVSLTCGIVAVIAAIAALATATKKPELQRTKHFALAAAALLLGLFRIAGGFTG